MERLSLGARVVRDGVAGLVVFLVALPLCLGVALASKGTGVSPEQNLTLASGLLAGIIGGIVVGALSGSATSVSGPAAGLTAVVAAEITGLGSFQAFLAALVIAGAIQIVLGLFRLGTIAAFFPSSIIKGLLAAIGLILILKQIPHLLGHDKDPEGEMSFFQPDNETTFSELVKLMGDLHPGAATLGLILLGGLFLWDRIPALKKSPIPAPLLVVGLGVAGSALLNWVGNPAWIIGPTHLVAVPVTKQLSELQQFLTMPDWSLVNTSQLWIAAGTIAVVASLETLLNLEAVDKLDPQKRVSPPNRELLAQGVGNITAGLLGGLPVTSVIVRSSVNISAGATSKLSTLVHGFLILGAVVTIPQMLNLIPLASLAAILLHTGVKLCNPQLIRQQWREGSSQFIPFVVTVVAIVFTDLLIGVSIGLAVAIGFILRNDLRTPIRQIHEKHLSGEVLRIVLGDRVSFLNRAALARVLDRVPPHSTVLLDARSTTFIDPDILDLLNDFQRETAPARQISVSHIGFQDRYRIQDHIEYVDFSSRDLQQAITPEQVIQILRDGNQRFLSGHRLTRDLGRLVDATASGQFPLAAVLSCMDSRTPSEIIFDLALGDVFTVRIAGNVAREKVLGSLEYACAVARAKLIVVLGHTHCGAVTAAVELLIEGKTALEVTSCEHLDVLVAEIQQAVDLKTSRACKTEAERSANVDRVAKLNVQRVIHGLMEHSHTLSRLVQERKLQVIGGMYDVRSGRVEFFDELGAPLPVPRAEPPTSELVTSEPIPGR